MYGVKSNRFCTEMHRKPEQGGSKGARDIQDISIMRYVTRNHNKKRVKKRKRKAANITASREKLKLQVCW
jgi:hypothetical protein